MSGISYKSYKGIDELNAKIDKVLIKFPEKRRELHEKSGEIILTCVKRNTPPIGKSSKLRDAIYLKVGSKGGYAAVRPDYKKAPHAHLVEDGHVQKDHDGVSTGQFVEGKHMFKIGAQEAQREVYKLAENFANDMAGELK